MQRRWMNVRVRGLLCIALWGTASWWDAAIAQPPPAPSGRPSSDPASTRSIAEVGPELFYVEDDGGRLVPVPGFRYRDFIELLRLKDGLPSQPEPPAAVLETFALLATVPQPPAGEAAAALSCPAEVRLTVRQLRPGWVSVPIDLRGFLVGGVPAHEGPGEMFLAADGGGEGGMARLWLNSTEGGNDVRHTVTLRGVVPVESSSIADTATFFVPSATASRVEVRTRRQDPSVTVRPASSPALIEPAPVAGEGSVVKIGRAHV